MKTLALILLTLSLTGCFHQSVNFNDIQTAIKACGSLDNIVEIEAHATGGEYVRCSDRTYILLDERVWGKK